MHLSLFYFIFSLPRWTTKQLWPLTLEQLLLAIVICPKMEVFSYNLFIIADICCKVFLLLFHVSSPVCLPMGLHPCLCMSFPCTLSNRLIFVLFQKPRIWSIVVTCFPVTEFFWLLAAWLICPLACLVLKLHGSTPYNLTLNIRYCAA